MTMPDYPQRDRRSGDRRSLQQNSRKAKFSRRQVLAGGAGLSGALLIAGAGRAGGGAGWSDAGGRPRDAQRAAG